MGQTIAPKFYYFDVGVTAHMENRRPVLPGSVMFGKALERGGNITKQLYTHCFTNLLTILHIIKNQYKVLTYILYEYLIIQ